MPPGPVACTPSEVLLELRRRGASGLVQVRFRRNRTVLWSLTDRGRVLNLHAAYAAAPPEILDAFALLVRDGARRTAAAGRAARRVREWPPVAEAMERLRGVQAAAALSAAQSVAPHSHRWGEATGLRCAGDAEERQRVRELYAGFNRSRFGGVLPPGIPLRLSGRMRRRLGHMRPGTAPGGARVVVEIALSRLLLLPANALLLDDVLLHEMAHAADWLVDGRAGHGPTWKAWARRVGCHPRACTNLPVREPTGGAAGGANRRRGRG